MIHEATNPAMITVARESRGLTQSELSPELGVSQAQLSKFEAGLLPPSQEAISSLSRVLRYPVTFFTQWVPLYGPGMSEYFHRKRQDVPAKLLKQAHAQIYIRILHLTELLRAVDLRECKIPRLDPEEFRGAAEIAAVVRALWQLPTGPVQNVVDAIEAAGGIVVPCAFGSPRIDGVSRWVPGLPPLFFVNEGLPVDRVRHTLCHELGHLIMHGSPREEMEEEANSFAAAFLMPEKEVRPYLESLSIHKLAGLKPYWKCSMAAILKRAQDLGRVSERQARFLWMKISSAGYKRREPPELDLPPENPRLLAELIALYHDQLGYTDTDLATLTHSDPEDFASIYNLPASVGDARTSLRLVK